MIEEKISNIIRDYEVYAEKNNLRLNSNKVLVNGLINKILENEKKYGKRYCPCRLINNDCEDKKKICPCQFLKNEIEKNSQCHCGLFVKNEKD